MTTVAGLLRNRAGDAHPGLVFEDRAWTWDDVVGESAVRAAVLADRLDAGRPRHVGVLLENVPEYLFLIYGAALAGATIVGINPTRRGAELARDVEHTRCQLILTDREHAALLPPGLQPQIVDSPEWAAQLAAHSREPLPADDPPASTDLFLLFTSGSTSAPKAVRCSTGRTAMAGVHCTQIYGIHRDDICYCPMPLFHGNALLACVAPATAAGATIVLRRKFSASGFLVDVRRYQATYFTYVGRTIAYILAQPATADDADNRLRLGFGTEATAIDRERFEQRFGCPLVEGYGSSESVISITRTPDTPPNALGKPQDPAMDVAIVDPLTGQECPPAEFDERGALVNGNVAIGEIVNRAGAGRFEGYFDNPAADEERLRGGWYWSGDLGYRDAAGFFYFAGRNADWLRVDSENFAAAPVENILARWPGQVMVAVYAVPDTRTGDQVMAAVELPPGEAFDAAGFGEFLAAQNDLGTKWAPRFVRVVDAIPLTANNKVHKPPLRAAGWWSGGELWWRRDRELRYERLTPHDRRVLLAEMEANGRRHLAGS